MNSNPTPLGDSEWESHMEKDPKKREESKRRLLKWVPLLKAKSSRSYLEYQIQLIEEYANTGD